MKCCTCPQHSTGPHIKHDNEMLLGPTHSTPSYGSPAVVRPQSTKGLVPEVHQCSLLCRIQASCFCSFMECLHKVCTLVLWLRHLAYTAPRCCAVEAIALGPTGGHTFKPLRFLGQTVTVAQGRANQAFSLVLVSALHPEPKDISTDIVFHRSYVAATTRCGLIHPA